MPRSGEDLGVSNGFRLVDLDVRLKLRVTHNPIVGDPWDCLFVLEVLGLLSGIAP